MWGCKSVLVASPTAHARPRGNWSPLKVPSQPICLSLQELDVAVGMGIAVCGGIPIPDRIEVGKGFGSVVEG
jgi:hypothetical protein